MVSYKKELRVQPVAKTNMISLSIRTEGTDGTRSQKGLLTFHKDDERKDALIEEAIKETQKSIYGHGEFRVLWSNNPNPVSVSGRESVHSRRFPQDLQRVLKSLN